MTLKENQKKLNQVNQEYIWNKMNVVIVHGCPQNEERAKNLEKRTYDKHWMPWIKDELAQNNISVEIPLMPSPWNPDYNSWKAKMDDLNINEDSVLIGHSCGCAFLVRWLGDAKKKIKKLILVAPWKIPSREYSDGENELYGFDIDLKIRKNVREIIIFTSNDEDEDGKESAKIFHEILGGRIIELENHGHYVEGDMGTNEFLELLDVVLE